MVPTRYIDTIQMYNECDEYKNTHTPKEFQDLLYAVARDYACMTGWFMIEDRKYRALYIKPIYFHWL